MVSTDSFSASDISVKHSRNMLMWSSLGCTRPETVSRIAVGRRPASA